jgi:hypothetical protein
MKLKEINNTEKKSNSSEMYTSKRNTWNSRRKYNYRYVTTVL